MSVVECISSAEDGYIYHSYINYLFASSHFSHTLSFSLTADPPLDHLLVGSSFSLHNHILVKDV